VNASASFDAFAGEISSSGENRVLA